jgi:hypothetical protein
MTWIDHDSRLEANRKVNVRGSRREGAHAES